MSNSMILPRDSSKISYMQDYNDNSKPQLSSIQTLINLEYVDLALRKILFDRGNGKTIFIGDIGASEGKNSIAFLKYVGEWLERNQFSGNSFVYHIDLPSNNFNVLIQEYQNNVDSYVVHPEWKMQGASVGNSFYNKCVPDLHLDLSFCCSALHWMSSVPSSLESTTWIHSGRVPQTTYKLWADAARKDWKTILQMRANETKNKGLLLLANPAQSDAGNKQKLLIGELSRDIFDDMRPLGLLPQGFTKEMEHSFVLPFYRRTLSEHLDQEILQETGWQVLLAEVRTVPNPFWKKFSNDSCVQEFVSNYVNHIRAINTSSLSRCFEQIVSDEKIVVEHVNQYFNFMQTKILQLINEDKVDNHHENSVVRQLAKDQYTCFMVLEKTTVE